MPAEPTKSKLKRRNSRKDLEEYRFDGNHGRELELKRNRGSLATGQGTRFVLAATEHLHRRIAKLSNRIRLLEDALSSLQAKHSLIHVEERDGEADGEADDGSAPSAPGGEVLEAFGTLSISENGISRFFGPTGGSEVANLDSKDASPEMSHTPDSLQETKSQSSIGDLALFSQSFPFTPMGQLSDVQELVESHLPPFERTVVLCQTYFDQAGWLFRGVTRIQVFDDMLPVIYKQKPSPFGEDYSGPHDLSMLFMVMAIGSLVGSESSTALGEHYHQVARAAISLQPILEKPSIVTIQSLHLMSIYNAMSGSDLKSETSMEMTWSLITLASHLSQTFPSTDRDSARWGLTPKMIQRRRILFWDLFVADVWTSLNTGRPPSFSLAYIDCSFPEYGPDDSASSAFEIWQFRFAAECVAEVTSRTLTAEAPTYATIMELDRKVRDFALPETIVASRNDFGATFQRCVLEHVRETILLYIHRSFFAQAIIEHPVNPLKSTYAPSFLAAYRASSTILKSIREQFSLWPNASARFWTMWTFGFSAAVGVCLQHQSNESTRALYFSNCSPSKNLIIILFQPVLTKLSEKARNALSSAQSEQIPMTVDKGGMYWNIKEEETEDELSIFAGHTRFVNAKRNPDSTTTSPPHSIRLEPSPPFHINIPSNFPLPSIGSGSSSNNWDQTIPLHVSDPYIPPPTGAQPHPYSSVEPASQQISASDIRSSTYGWPLGPSQPPHSAPTSYHHQIHPIIITWTRTPFNRQPLRQSSSQPGLYAMYATGGAPDYRVQAEGPTTMDLANLGLASRDSRLDERWSSFISDSGLLSDFRGQ
ncbi:fungal-specific transcription factor domain-containing protein [Gymnopilus junonius]|uniref:Fungal-specific transcription factor domain-containing protein n=1 Tax=Gymnopilus junonius TaxID=109634 RepID=A0A9P5THY8_GYMJU|nr:fungal-specific transcription factor domain-containing protein [Gymnopilus junonius]